MKLKHIITVCVALVAAALSAGCHKKQDAVTPHVTVIVDGGTNVTMITNSGHVIMVGRFITNDVTKPKFR